MIEYCQTMLIYLCVGVFGCLALVWLAMFVHAQTRRFVACFRRGGRFNAALALIAVGAMVVYGGSKPAPPTPGPDPEDPVETQQVYTVTNVTAKQRYPWNRLVDIACNVSGIDGASNGLYFVVSAVDLDSNTTNNVSNLWVVQNGVKTSDLAVSANDNYSLLWDAQADLESGVYSNMVVRVTLWSMCGNGSTSACASSFSSGAPPAGAVLAFVVNAGDSAPFILDTMDGPRASDGSELLTYSSLWDGGDGATVTIAQDGEALAEGLTGEGECAWSVTSNGTYVLTHTTYTNGVSGTVETATFVVTDRDDPSSAVDVFDGLPVTIEQDGENGWTVTVTNDIAAAGLPIELPDNIGPVTIDLNGHDLVGPDGQPVIVIVPGSGAGEPTVIAVVNSGDDAEVRGGEGASAIVVADVAQDGVVINIGERVSVQGGDEFTPAIDGEIGTNEGTIVEPAVIQIRAGEYFKATLAELGYDVPTNGTAYSVVAYGLPAGLKLKYNAAVTKKRGKKTVVVKPAKVEWWIEGVPTAKLDYFTNPPYLVITVNGVSVTAPLPIQVAAQEVTELPDLVLGQSLNEQYYLQGVGAGWTVSGLPTGLKYATKKVTKTTGSGKKKVTTTVAEAYAVYGKTTKAGLFTITAKKKAGAFYETKKFRVLVRPAAVDTALFGEDLTNITTMAYVPINWDLTGSAPSVPPVPFVPSSIGGSLAKVTGLPTGLSFAASDAYGYTNAKKKTGKYLKQKGQTIVGTPTKAGTYVVTFTKNVKEKVKGKMKTVAKTAQILWVVTQNDAELSLGFNTMGGVIESGVVGLKYTDLMAFSATSNATVTAIGLPAGITLANLGGGQYAFTGFTAKAGTYLVTVKATLNGKAVTQRVALKVDALPAWAKGTFNGYVAGTDYATNGLATITVSAAGKISGKFYDRGTNWTFTAASYTGYDNDASAYTVPIEAKFSYTVKEKVKVKGKWTTKSVKKSVARSFTLAVVDNGKLGGTATLVEAGVGSTVHVRQNLWGSTYKALGKTLFSSKSGKKTLAYKTFSIKSTDPAGAAMGLLPTETLSLKVTTAGAVTATMSFDTGKRSKGKAVVYKATCSTVVIPLTEPDAPAAEFKGEAHLYFAPSTKNNFTGFVGAVPF